MTNQEIIDYVMETPNNTNPVILNQMLETNKGSQNLGHNVLIDDDNEIMTVGTYDILCESIKNLKVPNAAVYTKSDSSIEVSACKSAKLENGGITLVFDAGNGNILYGVKPDGSVFWFE